MHCHGLHVSSDPKSTPQNIDGHHQVAVWTNFTPWIPVAVPGPPLSDAAPTPMCCTKLQLCDESVAVVAALQGRGGEDSSLPSLLSLCRHPALPGYLCPPATPPPHLLPGMRTFLPTSTAGGL
eukprot:GGOE01021162.1.p3 GENE.GGOE01021162.1~~GGOE01021162.1.p3  ORF type:complete len:123 (-),score=12.05 GGOE01021162.1:44-412(-)